MNQAHLFQQALDDPETGLMIFDADLRLVHWTSHLAPLLGIEASVLHLGVDTMQILRSADFSADSLRIAEAQILRAAARDSCNPPVLHLKQSPAEIQMRVRDIGTGYQLVAFNQNLAAPVADDNSNPALKDSLTGLANRTQFEKSVLKVLEQRFSQPVAIFLLDLDRFKAVNDTLGHAAGDAVLQLTAKRLQSVVREADVISRLGGDEFAVMIHPDRAPSDLAATAGRIVDLIGRTFLVEGQLVNIGCSIGIALAPQDATEYSSLLRCADLALYNAKNRGRGDYSFFSSDMELRAQARRTSELDLRRALALRQLELYYQPQVDIEKGYIEGFEALLRWRHPQRGFIAPSDFLPLAEEIGVIIPIGEWVLRTACREAMNWPPTMTVAVNASPLQFHAGHFADSVRNALVISGLPGHRLEIEITEGILFRNETSVMTTLHDLRSMGVSIAMDDFGTGYASLSQLANFPFDKIKIDKSLVGAAGESAKHRAIVRAISTMGESLGVTTIAEGIETSEQMARCKLDGCGSVQGFLFSRPVASSELAALIASMPTQTLSEKTLPLIERFK